MEDEQKIISLVKEMADLLEGIAVNAYHTPGKTRLPHDVHDIRLNQLPLLALYSTFLKALVTAKTEASIPPSPSLRSVDGRAVSMVANHEIPESGLPNEKMLSEGMLELKAASENSFMTGQFDLSGEMGPVQDMSTFPPTMAPVAEDNFGMFSMDNMFSNGFWDSVLVPGKVSLHPLIYQISNHELLL